MEAINTNKLEKQEELKNAVSIKSETLSDYEEWLDSLENASEAARQTLLNLQKVADKIFEPAVKLDWIQITIPDEMLKNGIPLDMKQRPKELKQSFSRQDLKQNPEKLNFVVDFMMLYANVEQALLDVEQMRLNKDANAATPAIWNVQISLSNIIAKYPNRFPHEIVESLVDWILNMEWQWIMTSKEVDMRKEWMKRVFYWTSQEVKDVVLSYWKRIDNPK